MTWTLLFALFSGFIIGKLQILPLGLNKYTDHLIQFGVILLLISMGISIGFNDSIVRKIPYLGWQAFLFSFLSVGFSIIILHFGVNKILSLTDSNKEEMVNDNMDSHS